MADSQSQPAAVLPSFDLIAGPPLISLCLSWALLGVMLTQVFIYHNNFPKDRLACKFLVYGVLVLDCLQSVMYMKDAFSYFVYNWGDSEVWNTIKLTWFSLAILDGVIAVIVQLTFAWRLWNISYSVLLTGTVSVLALLQLSGAITYGVYMKIATYQPPGTSYHNTFSLTRRPAIVWLTSSVAVDVIIAVSMIILLHKWKGPILSTNRMINKLIMVTLETGTLTASVAILTLVLFFAYPTNLMYTCPALILGKMYSNTLIAIFNHRKNLRSSEPNPLSSSISAFRSPPPTSPLERVFQQITENRSRTPVRVYVHQESATFTDNTIEQDKETVRSRSDSVYSAATRENVTV